LVWGEPELSPQPTIIVVARTSEDAARAGNLRLRANRTLAANSVAIHAPSIGPAGKLAGGTALPVVGAVVVTVTVTAAAVTPARLTELGTVHVGTGCATEGVMLHVRLTGPLNPPEDVTSRLKLAVWPALTVAEVGDPGVGPSAKLGAACTTSVKGMLVWMGPEVPVILTL